MRYFLVILCGWLLFSDGVTCLRAEEKAPWLYVYVASVRDDENRLAAKIALDTVEPTLVLRDWRKAATVYGAVVVRLTPEDAASMTKLRTGPPERESQKVIYFVSAARQVVAFFVTRPGGALEQSDPNFSRAVIGGKELPSGVEFIDDAILFNGSNTDIVAYLRGRLEL